MSLDFWYDAQLRRYWLQFCRIFEGFQFESGVGSSGVKTLRTFPVKLASKNRQVGHILRNNSENTILSTPQITCEMIDIQMAPERRQAPNHISSVNIFERAIDPVTNRYTGELGNTYTVERYMAIPYNITMRVDIWTSNEMQKHQFMEQVLVLFNPSIDLQTGDNPIDFTSLTIVELDSISWTNREMPIGSDSDIEISSLTFKMPIWLNPPAKIKKQNIIHQIITNIGALDGETSYTPEQAGGYNFSSRDLYSRLIVTPGNHQVGVSVIDGQYEIQLLSQEGLDVDPQGNPYDWRKLLQRYGPYRAGVSQFRLKTTNDIDDDDGDIIGIFDFHPTQIDRIFWTPDLETLPVNTLSPIIGMVTLKSPEPNRGAVIPPLRVGRWPGDGVLPEAATGQRYLLADDLPQDSKWPQRVDSQGNLILPATANDIIEFDGQNWFVVFDSSNVSETQIVFNQRSSRQLKWTGEMWVDAISADYFPGYWRIFL